MSGDQPPPLLRLRGLQAHSAAANGEVLPLLRGVDLDVAEGEMLCLVGASGAGKSLTALAVMGLLPPSVRLCGGSIRLLGEDLTTAGERRLRRLRGRTVAMVFQEPLTALNPLLPVGRQIEEAIAAHQRSTHRERRRRAVEMLLQVGLLDVERIAAAYPHQLSGGQRQRAMIAMALALKPRLLIADEPTTALDVVTQQQILRLLKDLCRRLGTAVLYITHDMGVVSEVADRVAVMHEGRVVEQGPLRTVLTAPREEPTRALIRAVPSLVPRAPRSSAGGGIALEVGALSKTFTAGSWLRRRHAVEALADVDLTLREGTTLGVIGESGSGKSTLAQCILRLIEPTRGSIRLDGQEIAHLPSGALKPHRRKMQAVFQDPYRTLNPRLPIGASIIEGPLNFGIARAEALALARDLLRMVGLAEDALALRPHEFSGGERQRIALARALALRPKVLIADEPVSALDMPTQARVLELLDDIRQRTGIAILFITHDLRVAARICDEIVIMRAGRIVERGATRALLTAPGHPYTRQLCAAAPGRNWHFAAERPLTPLDGAGASSGAGGAPPRKAERA